MIIISIVLIFVLNDIINGQTFDDACWACCCSKKHNYNDKKLEKNFTIGCQNPNLDPGSTFSFFLITF